MILCPPHGDADRSELASTECCLGGCVIALSLLSLVACGQHLTRGQKNAGGYLPSHRLWGDHCMTQILLMQNGVK